MKLSDEEQAMIEALAEDSGLAAEAVARLYLVARTRLEGLTDASSDTSTLATQLVTNVIKQTSKRQ